MRNLAAFLPGFEGSVLNRKGTLIGFLKFINQKAAIAAMHMLNGHQFDGDSRDGCLRVSMAKRNMNISTRGGGYNSRILAMQSYNPYNPYMPQGDFAMGAGAYPMGGPDPYGGAAAMAGGMAVPEGYGGGYDFAGHQQQQQQQSFEPQTQQVMSVPIASNTRGTACDTLCIQGLTPWTTQGDVEGTFSAIQGFTDIKVFGRKSLGFVRFDSQQSALAAMEDLNGGTVSLPGADSRTSMRLEYAKRSLEERPPARNRDDSTSRDESARDE